MRGYHHGSKYDFFALPMVLEVEEENIDCSDEEASSTQQPSSENRNSVTRGKQGAAATSATASSNRSYTKPRGKQLEEKNGGQTEEKENARGLAGATAAGGGGSSSMMFLMYGQHSVPSTPKGSEGLTPSGEQLMMMKDGSESAAAATERTTPWESRKPDLISPLASPSFFPSYTSVLPASIPGSPMLEREWRSLLQAGSDSRDYDEQDPLAMGRHRSTSAGQLGGQGEGGFGRSEVVERGGLRGEDREAVVMRLIELKRQQSEETEREGRRQVMEKAAEGQVEEVGPESGMWGKGEEGERESRSEEDNDKEATKFGRGNKPGWKAVELVSWFMGKVSLKTDGGNKGEKKGLAGVRPRHMKIEVAGAGPDADDGRTCDRGEQEMGDRDKVSNQGWAAVSEVRKDGKNRTQKDPGLSGWQEQVLVANSRYDGYTEDKSHCGTEDQENEDEKDEEDASQSEGGFPEPPIKDELTRAVWSRVQFAPDFELSELCSDRTDTDYFARVAKYFPFGAFVIFMILQSIAATIKNPSEERAMTSLALVLTGALAFLSPFFKRITDIPLPNRLQWPYILRLGGSQYFIYLDSHTVAHAVTALVAFTAIAICNDSVRPVLFADLKPHWFLLLQLIALLVACGLSFIVIDHVPSLRTAPEPLFHKLFWGEEDYAFSKIQISAEDSDDTFGPSGSTTSSQYETSESPYSSSRYTTSSVNMPGVIECMDRNELGLVGMDAASHSPLHSIDQMMATWPSQGDIIVDEDFTMENVQEVVEGKEKRLASREASNDMLQTLATLTSERDTINDQDFTMEDAQDLAEGKEMTKLASRQAKNDMLQMLATLPSQGDVINEQGFTMEEAQEVAERKEKRKLASRQAKNDMLQMLKRLEQEAIDLRSSRPIAADWTEESCRSLGNALRQPSDGCSGPTVDNEEKMEPIENFKLKGVFLPSTATSPPRAMPILARTPDHFKHSTTMSSDLRESVGSVQSFHEGLPKFHDMESTESPLCRIGTPVRLPQHEENSMRQELWRHSDEENLSPSPLNLGSPDEDHP